MEEATPVLIVKGSELRRLRLARLWSQTDLAAKLGASTSQVSEWEKGTPRIAGRTAKKLAKVFGVDPMDICGVIDEKPASVQ